jgi:N-dimethylarginine dimethylaminohydrolase
MTITQDESRSLSAPEPPQLPEGWGLNNQSRRLTDVLLGRPDAFEWVPLNAISAMTFANAERLGHRFDREAAMSQHRAMVHVYEDAGVRVHYLDWDPGLPSSVFARDSSFMTPWGAVVASIQTRPRRRDHAVVVPFYLDAGIPIWNWVTAGHFEGGDFAIVAPGACLLGYAGTRSTREGADQVAAWMAAEGWEALTVALAPQFVHMDACLVMLADDLALLCEDALEEYVLDWLRGHGVRWLPVSYRDCVRLGGNLVNLGDGRILSMAHNVSVNERLRAEGFDVSVIEYDQFALGGGGVHCSCHELRRDPA